MKRRPSSRILHQNFCFVFLFEFLCLNLKLTFFSEVSCSWWFFCFFRIMCVAWTCENIYFMSRRDLIMNLNSFEIPSSPKKNLALTKKGAQNVNMLFFFLLFLVAMLWNILKFGLKLTMYDETHNMSWRKKSGFYGIFYRLETSRLDC